MTALSDPFTRADENPVTTPWAQEVALAQLVTNAVVFTDPVCLYVHDTALDDISQYQLASFAGVQDANLTTPYFVFRYTDSASPYYTVRLLTATNTVEWRSHTSTADAAGTLIDTTSLTIGSTLTIGFTIDGTGNGTVVRGWVSPTGLPVNPQNWDGDDTPDITFTANPGSAVDTGLQIGWGVDTGNPFAASMDNWFGGDTPSGIVLPTYRTKIIWQIEYDWKPQRYDFPVGVDLLLDDWTPDASATPGAMSGTAAWTWGQSGDLKGAGALSGTSAWTWSQSGTLRGSGALSATVAWTWGQSGDLKGSGALAGTIPWTWSQSADLKGAGALAGTSSWTWSQSATLAGAGALAGTIPWTWSQSGDLVDSTPPGGALSGTIAWTWNQSGDLKGAGALAGTIPWTWGQAGTLAGSGALAGVASWTWSQSGTLTDSTSGAIAGTAAWTWGASGELTNLTPVANVSATPGFFDHFHAHRERRRRELEEIEQRERETLEIQDELDRQIAEQFRADELRQAKLAEKVRLQRLAELAAAQPFQFPPHVLEAIELAAERRTLALLLKMQDEILRMYAEEEAAVMAALMLDDDDPVMVVLYVPSPTV